MVLSVFPPGWVAIATASADAGSEISAAGSADSAAMLGRGRCCSHTASNGEFSMSPAELTEATKQLDALADLVEGLVQTEAPNLTVVATGRNEAPQQVGTTLNEVHGDFTKSTDQGTTEIRETAAALRAHTDHIVTADQNLAV